MNNFLLILVFLISIYLYAIIAHSQQNSHMHIWIIYEWLSWFTMFGPLIELCLCVSALSSVLHYIFFRRFLFVCVWRQTVAMRLKIDFRAIWLICNVNSVTTITTTFIILYVYINIKLGMYIGIEVCMYRPIKCIYIIILLLSFLWAQTCFVLI